MRRHHWLLSGIDAMTPLAEHATTALPVRTALFSACVQADHLFDLRVGNISALERLYPTVRGHDWRPSQITTSAIAVTTDTNGFTLNTTSDHRVEGGNLTCRLAVQGHGGVIDVRAIFTAVTDVTVRRIGLCLIHPMTSAAKRLTCVSADGRITRTSFTRSISSSRLATGAVEVTAELGGTTALEIRAHGAGIDIEDHRNWGDPGWKSYLPPLATGDLIRLPTGTTITRHLQLTYTTRQPAVPRSNGTCQPTTTITVGPPTRIRLPSIGTVTDGPMTAAGAAELRALGPNHLLTAWNPEQDPEALSRAAADAAALGVGLEVNIAAERPSWNKIAAALDCQPPGLLSVRVAAAGTVASLTDAVAELRRHLHGSGRPVPVGGFAASFAGLNRAGLRAGDLDIAAYGLTPQTHHTDDRHIMQTPAVQRSVLHHARNVAKTSRIGVGPITWTRAGTDPDPRLFAPIAAAWLVGVVSYVPDAVSLTCFTARQLTNAAGSPLARVFAVLASEGGQRLHQVRCARPTVRVLAFRTRVLVANLGLTPIRAAIVDAGRPAGVFTIDPLSCRIVPRDLAGQDG